MLGTAAILVSVLVIAWIARFTTGSRPVLVEAFDHVPGSDSAVVVGPFELDGRASNLAVAVETNVSNNWVYFEYALLDTQTGEAREFGREVGYYFGREGGESWSEGSRRDRAVIPRVPSGTYMLRIAPEGPAPTHYRVRLLRDAPVTSFWVMSLIVLLVPPGVTLMRQQSFRTRRWAESDYADD